MFADPFCYQAHRRLKGSCLKQDRVLPAVGISTPGRYRLRAVVELVVVIGTLELLIWYLHDRAHSLWTSCAVTVLLAVGYLSIRRTRVTTSHRIHQAPAYLAWKHAGAITLLAAVLLAMFGLASGTFEIVSLGKEFTSKPASHWLLVKAPTVLAQEIGVQWFLLPLCLELFRSKGVGIGAAASVFAILHLPNLPLVLITLLSGVVWCWLYASTGRIAPVIVSHFLLAVLVANVAERELYQLRVGPSCIPLIPSTVRASDGSTLQTDPGELRGCVCRFKRANAHIICTGWMFDRHKVMPHQLILLADGQFRAISIQSPRPRPDVVEHFGDPELEWCGFCVRVPTEWFAGDPVRFFGQTRSGEVAELTVTAKERLP